MLKSPGYDENSRRLLSSIVFDFLDNSYKPEYNQRWLALSRAGALYLSPNQMSQLYKRRKNAVAEIFLTLYLLCWYIAVCVFACKKFSSYVRKNPPPLPKKSRFFCLKIHSAAQYWFIRFKLSKWQLNRTKLWKTRTSLPQDSTIAPNLIWHLLIVTLKRNTPFHNDTGDFCNENVRLQIFGNLTPRVMKVWFIQHSGN